MLFCFIHTLHSILLRNRGWIYQTNTILVSVTSTLLLKNALAHFPKCVTTPLDQSSDKPLVSNMTFQTYSVLQLSVPFCKASEDHRITRIIQIILHVSLISDCCRIHLQHRIEDEEQCDWLIKDLQAQIQQAYSAEIHDKDVLHEDYIRRVLHLRKVTVTVYLQICFHTMLPCLYTIFSAC